MADEKRRDDIGIELADRNEQSPSAQLVAEAQNVPDMASHGGVSNNPVLAIASYCGSSILMTVTNKYVLSGVDFNLSFFLLAIQVRQLVQA